MMIKIIRVVFICFLAIGQCFAIEEPDRQTRDISLASVWAISKFTQGGYFRPGVKLTKLDETLSVLPGLGAGWRFTPAFSFGASLYGTANEVESIADKLIFFALVADYQTNNLALGDILFELDLGSVYAETESLNTNYFALAVSREIFSRTMKKTRLKTHLGLAYRKLLDNPWEQNSDSLSGFSLTLNLQFQ